MVPELNELSSDSSISGQPRLLDLLAINEQWNTGSNPSYPDISRAVPPKRNLLTPQRAMGHLAFSQDWIDLVTFYESSHPVTCTKDTHLGSSALT